MTLNTDVLNSINMLVRGGFEDRDDIIDIIAEDIYGIDPEAVAPIVDQAIELLEQEQASWPAITDCDKLDQAFEQLNQKGIVALQYAGYTQGEGYTEVMEALEGDQCANAFGYCYFHGQDLERVLDSGQLYLSFGPLDASTEQTQGPRVGAMVVEALRKVGLTTVWDGTFDQRIGLTNFDWKKRPS